MGIRVLDTAPAGGGVTGAAPAPITFTKFNDLTQWTPVGNANVTQTFGAGGQLTLAGNAAPDANVWPALSGVVYRGLVFPSNTTGIFEVNAVFDTYTRPTDIAGGRYFIWGLGIYDRYPIFTGGTHFCAYGGNVAGPIDLLINGGIQITSDLSVINSYNAAAPATTTFTVRTRVARVLTGGFYRWVVDKAICDKDGAEPQIGGDPLAYNASNACVAGFLGVGLFVGVFNNSKSALGTARLTSVNLVTGQAVNQ